MYISDNDNARVVKLSSNGTLIREFTTSNPSLIPEGLALDSTESRLYVCDDTNSRVVWFSLTASSSSVSSASASSSFVSSSAPSSAPARSLTSSSPSVFPAASSSASSLPPQSVPYVLVPLSSVSVGVAVDAAGANVYLTNSTSVSHLSAASNGSWFVDRALYAGAVGVHGLAVSSDTSLLCFTDFYSLNVVCFNPTAGGLLGSVSSIRVRVWE